MKRIYLDYQLIIDNVDGRDYGFDLLKIDQEKFEIVYSPAHIEEIANGNLNKKLKGNLDNYLSFLSNITSNKEIIYGYANTYSVITNFFNKSCGLLIVNEEPEYCYDRVIKYIHKNEISKQGQSEVFSRSNSLFEGLKGKALSKKKTQINHSDILSFLNLDSSKRKLLEKVVDTFIVSVAQDYLISNGIPINNIGNNDFFYIINPIVYEFSKFRPIFDEFFYKIISGSKIYSEIRKNFPWVENFVDNVMKILLEEGFYSEDSEKVVSNIHDTTHCIYASYCDYFITRDKRLYKKVEVIYQFLGIPTKVIYADHDNYWTKEFIYQEN